MGAVRGFGIVIPVVSVSAETSMADGGAIMCLVLVCLAQDKKCDHFFVVCLALSHYPYSSDGEGKGERLCLMLCFIDVPWPT
jgi:hypothetical protein